MSDKQFITTLLPQVMQIMKSFKILHPISVQQEQQQEADSRNYTRTRIKAELYGVT
jgi:hypothetical protein